MKPRRIAPTLTGSQARRVRGRQGIVTGFLFKITRERLGLTQHRLAESLGVDVTSVQGWESGRRALTSLPWGRLRQMHRRLLTMGADPAILALVDAAQDADAVLCEALSEPRPEFEAHPLSCSVYTRPAFHMIAWALTENEPAMLPPTPSETPRRRGPTPGAPLLTPEERDRFFAHMRKCIEFGLHQGDRGALLRRQALYLYSYDQNSDTRTFLSDVRKAKFAKSWAENRSIATSITRFGELDHLHNFVSQLSDPDEIANLNYWAHWLGLVSFPRGSDSFMWEPPDWNPSTLLAALADRLSPGISCIDLNVHSLWTLLALRPNALASDPGLTKDLEQRVDILLEGGSVSAQARRELESVHYALKLSAR